MIQGCAPTSVNDELVLAEGIALLEIFCTLLYFSTSSPAISLLIKRHLDQLSGHYVSLSCLSVILTSVFIMPIIAAYDI